MDKVRRKRAIYAVLVFLKEGQVIMLKANKTPKPKPTIIGMNGGMGWGVPSPDRCVNLLTCVMLEGEWASYVHLKHNA